MARNTIKQTITVEDQASAEVRKVAETIAREAKKVEAGDKDIAKSAAEVRRERAKQLTVNQRYSFQLQKIQAGQDKVKVSLIGHQQALEKAKRELRLAVREGDEIPPQLAEEIRKRQGLITKLQQEIKARDKTTDEVEQGTRAQKKQALTLGDLKLKYIAAALAIRKVFTATRDLIIGTAAAADDMRKTSERLGITVEQFQQLDHAMQISGTSMENQRQAFAKLNKITRDAALGMGEASIKMERLGVKTTNADGSLRSTRDVLLDVADRFAAMDTGAEKTAASLDLFEESGYKMIQFLSLGREGIEELSAEATELGFIIGEKAAREAELFNDEMLRLKRRTQGVTQALSVGMIPSLTVVVTEFGKMFSASGQTGKQMRELGADLVSMGITVGQVFVSLGAIVKNAFDGIRVIVNTMIGHRLRSIGRMVSKIGGMFGLQADQLENMGQAMIDSAKDQTKAIIKTDAKAQTMIDNLEKIQAKVKETAANYKTELEPAAKSTNSTSAKLKGLIAEANEETKKHTGSIKLQKLATDELARKMQADIDEIREKKRAAAAEEYDQITGLINPALRALTSEADNFAEASKNALKAFVGVLGTMAEEAIRKFALSAAAGAASSQAPIPIIGPAMAAAAMSATLAMVMGLLTRMNKGGIVPGVGSVDKIPALLTPGELVLPKDLSSELLALVGKRPAGGAMAAGGLVTAGAGAGIVVNINEQVMTPRTPGELDRFVKDQLIPSLSRLRRRGF